jgi:hypothetical protein
MRRGRQDSSKGNLPEPKGNPGLPEAEPPEADRDPRSIPRSRSPFPVPRSSFLFVPKIRAQSWKDACVYLKHDEGDAPSVARRLLAMLG